MIFNLIWLNMLSMDIVHNISLLRQDQHMLFSFFFFSFLINPV